MRNAKRDTVTERPVIPLHEDILRKKKY